MRLVPLKSSISAPKIKSVVPHNPNIPDPNNGPHRPVLVPALRILVPLRPKTKPQLSILFPIR